MAARARVQDGDLLLWGQCKNGEVSCVDMVRDASMGPARQKAEDHAVNEVQSNGMKSSGRERRGHGADRAR